MSSPATPERRILRANDADVNVDGRYVLYWMRSARRASWNFALDRAVAWCRELGRPLIVFEGLRCGYRWASDRLHRFVIDGMQDNARAFSAANVTYYPRLESEPGVDQGLLEALAREACVVVTDDYPAFFLPRALEAAAKKMSVLLEAVDANGILPMRSTPKAFPTAYAFRRYLQRELHPHLEVRPRKVALRSLPAPVPVPAGVLKRWPAATLDEDLSAFPIDHTVLPSSLQGGSRAAERRWEAFLHERLSEYADGRNRPDEEGSSGISPYLHFGHISPHSMLHDLAEREDWSPDDVAADARGSRTGWWGMSEAAEAFLDQLITWRELGFNMCVHEPAGYAQYESLPEWARETMEVHEDDPRDAIYDLAAFEAAETHDELWNAAQRQLVSEGRIHNYMRMLWGKKIYEWSPSAREALGVMVELNNKYALDGRDPNSYSGIFWALGRYDRAWGPERPVYGKIRYMSSANTARKLRVKPYLAAYAE